MKKLALLSFLAFSFLLLGCTENRYASADCESFVGKESINLCYHYQALALSAEPRSTCPDCWEQAIDKCSNIHAGPIDDKAAYNRCITDVAANQKNEVLCNYIITEGLVSQFNILFNKEALVKTCQRKANPSRPLCSSAYIFLLFVGFSAFIGKRAFAKN